MAYQVSPVSSPTVTPPPPTATYDCSCQTSQPLYHRSSLFTQHSANCGTTSGDVSLPCGACQCPCLCPLHPPSSSPRLLTTALPPPPPPASLLSLHPHPPVMQEQPRPRACLPGCQGLYKTCLDCGGGQVSGAGLWRWKTFYRSCYPLSTCCLLPSCWDLDEPLPAGEWRWGSLFGLARACTSIVIE